MNKLNELNILVVDDEMFMRNLVRRLLTDIGFVGERIEFAANGMEAVKVIKDPEKRPNLVLLDLEMPGVDGFKFLEYLRSLKVAELRDIPVIVLTGHTEKDKVLKAGKLGVQGYLSKPISRATLENRIEAVLNPKE